MKQKTKTQLLTTNEAIDNLSTIAEMDFNANTLLGVVDHTRFVLSEGEYLSQTIEWLAPENPGEILEVLKLSYFSIFHYLQELFENPQTDWQDLKLKKSLQKMMELVGEATNNLDRYLSLFEGVELRAAALPEYKELSSYFLERIASHIEGGVEGADEWQREWVENEEALNFDLERRGLKDFEAVKRDREYELFYLRDENDRPFFTEDLLRNIKLVCDFDATANVEWAEDPLLKIQDFQDRDLHAAALQILHLVDPYIRAFYRGRFNYAEHPLAGHLNKAIMALMLAGNERHLLAKTLQKNCHLYFEDFQGFLREALLCNEYQKFLAYEDEKASFASRVLLDLTHHLCKAFYLRRFGVQEEMIGFIHQLIRKGQERKLTKMKESDSFLVKLMENDDHMRFFLRFFPNGPIFKDLDVIRNKENGGYDPIFQNNYPCFLYSVKILDKQVQIVKIPSPTIQTIISKAEPCREFLGFMRANAQEKHPKKHLLIQLQDKTSWKEFARAKTIEEMQNRAEWKGNLAVLTLTKDTDFYFQNAEYLSLNNAEEFLSVFLQQLLSLECGYFLHPTLMGEKGNRFIEKLLHWIHESIFEKKEVLTRKNRLDFIEIFYHFFILKLMQDSACDSISFTCKDGVDVGSAMSASFYAFIKLLEEGVLTKEEEDFLLFLFYTPSLLVRERAIDAQRMHRLLSALGHLAMVLKSQGKQMMKGMASLYGS